MKSFIEFGVITNFFPILIDEEAGRVSMLNNFIDNSIFSAKYFGDLFLKNRKQLK